MKAILVNPDQSLRWADVPDPILKEGECLVKVEAAGVNRADLMQREGNYPPPPGCPEWLGLEIAGTVVKIPDDVKEKTTIKEGDKVCALLGGGGYAQYVAVKYDMMIPIPDKVSVIEAAAMPEAFATSYLNLFIEGKAKAGDTLLMNGGNSGLASVLIPMAKAFGLRVITSVLTEDRIALIQHLHADRVISTDKMTVSEALKEEAEAGRPIDLAIDCVGGEDMGKCLHYMSHGGRWIMIAALAGADTHIDLKNIYVRNVRIIGSTLRSRTPAVKAEIMQKLVEEVWPFATAGKVRPTIYATMPITDAEKAHALLYAGTNVGKVVLTVD